MALGGRNFYLGFVTSNYFMIAPLAAVLAAAEKPRFFVSILRGQLVSFRAILASDTI